MDTTEEYRRRHSEGLAQYPRGEHARWPWESMHYEALAWHDHWLKGIDAGVMDGPPSANAMGIQAGCA
jgi:hypothetical protein